MINGALEHIQALLTNPADEFVRQSAEKFIRKVTPRWDSDRERLVVVHPDDGKEYTVALEDVNGSIALHVLTGDDSVVMLEMDDSYGDWSDTCLAAIFDDCPLNSCVFFVADDFKYDWV